MDRPEFDELLSIVAGLWPGQRGRLTSEQLDNWWFNLKSAPYAYAYKALKVIHDRDQPDYPPKASQVRSYAWQLYEQKKAERHAENPSADTDRAVHEAGVDLTIIEEAVSRMTDEDVAIYVEHARRTTAGRVFTRRPGTEHWMRAVYRASLELEVDF